MKILKKVAFDDEVRDLQNDELKEVDKVKKKKAKVQWFKVSIKGKINFWKGKRNSHKQK